MKSKIFGLRFTPSVFSLMLVLMLSTDCIAAIRAVPQDYDTIQTAIDAASSGDMVQVAPGTYHESIVMKDGVVIEGAGAEATIIDGDGSWAVVTGANGKIDGFTIRNGNYCISYGEQFKEATSPIITNNILKCGIGGGGYVDYQKGPIVPVIRNNIIFVDVISGNGQAIGLYLLEQAFANGGVNAVIENNTIIDTASRTGTSVGIELRSSQSLPTIKNNIIVGCWIGIDFAYPSLFEERKSLIWNNDVWNNGVNYWLNQPPQDFDMTGIQGNISADPLFVEGYYGDYYLSHTAAGGQARQSPCVDAGSDTAVNMGLDDRTTRTDAVPDSGVVDMGYHYAATPTDVTLLFSPNGGEVIPSGSVYTIHWGGSLNTVKFKLKYSTDNGITWENIHSKPYVRGTRYDWTIPVPWGNEEKCLVKVIGYDAAGNKVDEDTSNEVFTIAVVELTSPNGGEIFYRGDLEPITITWATNITKRKVKEVKLYYTENGGVTWVSIATIKGSNPGSYSWPIPFVSSEQCKVKVELKDVSGNILGTDTSDTFFTIQP